MMNEEATRQCGVSYGNTLQTASRALARALSEGLRNRRPVRRAG
ncbi:hypothetical protein DIQ79_31770 [Mycolicibacterium smegmatis]|uniref:Uncharacterized protein n=1 Tax=Mycolicibacterium smegmatis (strain ATCC 700084 / mc(2)155) TaxID=246196 RepID=A0QZJ9_MYCS2|nr:hypothetical protein MSMEG_4051 [Mycolicibacterium smegmatis MC2 155]TBM37509.1 hypothetical protein DIQ86_30025 [Mycolicibacterium smegmatis]TBH27052.1 hypothetical protein EYS45_31640 [Mycolicibacterium smegmatis MC2 155]TBM44160.1 hypothetical protein DIQ85_31690 [Mycolicibacterium smegmatis]TBM54061.1 hypothetical protein DIQ83_32020 [Mycolicibacterium smegmatis]